MRSRIASPRQGVPVIVLLNVHFIMCRSSSRLYLCLLLVTSLVAFLPITDVYRTRAWKISPSTETTNSGQLACLFGPRALSLQTAFRVIRPSIGTRNRWKSFLRRTRPCYCTMRVVFRENSPLVLSLSSLRCPDKSAVGGVNIRTRCDARPHAFRTLLLPPDKELWNCLFAKEWAK